jgi:hypothetical protein
MLETRSIKALYPFALAEGEGVGTAYEYAAKRRVMKPLFEHVKAGSRVLVAGLPEKYGTSLDFVLAAVDAGARVVAVDERQAAIDRAKKAIAECMRAPDVTFVRVDSLDAVARGEEFDVALSCEVLQRVPAHGRRDFAHALTRRAPRGVVFVPNSENPSHLEISGLGGFTKRGLADVLGARDGDVGYLDMPPFPPGITRTTEQRGHASSGLLEAIAMRGLDVYCAAERVVPEALARKIAHIVWGRWG